MSDHKTLAVIQAYDGVFMAELGLHGWDAVDEMLVRASRLHATRDAWLPAYHRRSILQRLAGLVAAEAEAFAILIAREGGKPLTDARVEVERAVNGIELAAEEIGRLEGRQIPMDLHRW